MNWKGFFKPQKSKGMLFVSLLIFWLGITPINFVIQSSHNNEVTGGIVAILIIILTVSLNLWMMIVFVLNQIPIPILGPVIMVLTGILLLPLNIVYLYFLSCLFVWLFRQFISKRVRL